MNISHFIALYKEAFTDKINLPIAIWYSKESKANTEPINGCFVKVLHRVLAGECISLNPLNIKCNGGKLYTEFGQMSPHTPKFVAEKEHYKKSPEFVEAYVESLELMIREDEYLHICRLDLLDSFDDVEALLFLVSPDVLSGLTTWAYFDNNNFDAVSAPFGSGCCTTITHVIKENKRNGNRTFVGLFDPSVRQYFNSNLLSYAIPMSRFRIMYETMKKSCLFGTHAWNKIKQRIEIEA